MGMKDGGKGEGRTTQPAPMLQLFPTETRCEVRERGAKMLWLPTRVDSMPVREQDQLLDLGEGSADSRHPTWKWLSSPIRMVFLVRLTMTTFSSTMQLLPRMIGPLIASRVQRGWRTVPARLIARQLLSCSSFRAADSPIPIVMSPRRSASLAMMHFEPMLKRFWLWRGDANGE